MNYIGLGLTEEQYKQLQVGDTFNEVIFDRVRKCVVTDIKFDKEQNCPVVYYDFGSSGWGRHDIKNKLIDISIINDNCPVDVKLSYDVDIPSDIIKTISFLGFKRTIVKTPKYKTVRVQQVVTINVENSKVSNEFKRVIDRIHNFGNSKIPESSCSFDFTDGDLTYKLCNIISYSDTEYTFTYTYIEDKNGYTQSSKYEGKYKIPVSYTGDILQYIKDNYNKCKL